MATPRKRWFRVADSILREDLTRDQRSTFLGLLAWFNQRRARDGVTGTATCRAVIPHGDLLTITVSDSLEEARALLEGVRTRFRLQVRPRGRFTEVYWPKLADFQEWDTPESGQSAGRARPVKRPPIAPSESDPNPIRSEPLEEEDMSPKRAAAAAPKRPRSRVEKSAAPDDLTTEQKIALRAWVRAKHPAEEPRLRDHVDACLDHHRARGNRMTSWELACRTWIRNAVRFERPANARAQANRSGVVPTAAETSAHLERIRKEYEAERNPDARH